MANGSNINNDEPFLQQAANYEAKLAAKDEEIKELRKQLEYQRTQKKYAQKKNMVMTGIIKSRVIADKGEEKEKLTKELRRISNTLNTVKNELVFKTQNVSHYKDTIKQKNKETVKMGFKLETLRRTSKIYEYQTYELEKQVKRLQKQVLNLEESLKLHSKFSKEESEQLLIDECIEKQ